MNSSLLELQELAATDLDLSLTGFDPKEIDDLRAGAQTAEGLTDEDAVPEVPEGWLGRKANGTAPPNAGAAHRKSARRIRARIGSSGIGGAAIGCNLQDQRTAVRFILNRTGKSKTEIPVDRVSVTPYDQR